MIAKSTKLTHPSGIEIETPLLIPSYSSKGFEMDSEGNSEIGEPMKICREFLEESVLISAYDLHHKHIPNPEDFVSTSVVFIDSGGYETGNNYDYSASRKYDRNSKKWDKELLTKTLQEWPSQYPSIIVNYDNEKERKPLGDQIKEAGEFFGQFPNALNDFLVKPETITSHYVKIDRVLSQIDKLKQFDIIGFTEKELANSIHRRMNNIKKVREALDRKKIKAPIHIFGSLDPVTSILYYLSGAEIFDGLTWLRYSYFNSMAIYHPNFCFYDKDIDIRTFDRQVQLHSLTKNIYFLEKMKYAMQDYQKSNGDFSFFDSLDNGDLSQLLKKSFDSIN